MPCRSYAILVLVIVGSTAHPPAKPGGHAAEHESKRCDERAAGDRLGSDRCRLGGLALGRLYTVVILVLVLGDLGASLPESPD